MANINELTITVELKQGIFYKLLENKLVIFILRHIPEIWVWWIATKSLMFRAGKNNKWQRLDCQLLRSKT
jgi:hypothetical protein